MKLANQSPQQQHSGQASNTKPMSSTTPVLCINTFQISDLPGFTPSPLATKKPVRVPQAKDKNARFELNMRIASQVVPKVLEARSLEVKCEVLTTGIYHLLSDLSPPQRTQTKRRHNPPSRELKSVTEKKKQLKKAFKDAKRANASKEVIAELAKEYHHCVRLHSKLVNVRRKRVEQQNVKATRNDFVRNFWKFSSRLLDKSVDSSETQPSCSAEEAHSYFSNEYSAQQHTFSQPSWLPTAPEPQHPLQCDEIQEDELLRVLRKARSGSTPSPIDQVPYSILKKCPAVITPLLHIYNLCWSSGKIPQQWKQAMIRLIPKSSAQERPNDLSRFRPIALTSCVGKLYTSILKDRLMQFMTKNRYIDTTTQ